MAKESSWPQVKDFINFDISYNTSQYSEEISDLCDKYREKFVGCETSSFVTSNSPSKYSGLKRQRKVVQSRPLETIRGYLTRRQKLLISSETMKEAQDKNIFGVPKKTILVSKKIVKKTSIKDSLAETSDPRTRRLINLGHSPSKLTRMAMKTSQLLRLKYKKQISSPKRAAVQWARTPTKRTVSSSPRKGVVTPRSGAQQTPSKLAAMTLSPVRILDTPPRMLRSGGTPRQLSDRLTPLSKLMLSTPGSCRKKKTTTTPSSSSRKVAATPRSGNRRSTPRRGAASGTTPSKRVTVATPRKNRTPRRSLFRSYTSAAADDDDNGEPRILGEPIVDDGNNSNSSFASSVNNGAADDDSMNSNKSGELSKSQKQKLLWAVNSAVKKAGIHMSARNLRLYGRRLYQRCERDWFESKAYATVKRGVSDFMMSLAVKHVTDVVRSINASLGGASSKSASTSNSSRTALIS